MGLVRMILFATSVLNLTFGAQAWASPDGGRRPDPMPWENPDYEAPVLNCSALRDVYGNVSFGGVGMRIEFQNRGAYLVHYPFSFDNVQYWPIQLVSNHQVGNNLVQTGVTSNGYTIAVTYARSYVPVTARISTGALFADCLP